MNNLSQNITSVIRKTALALLIATSVTGAAFAASKVEGAPEAEHVDWSWAGVFGTFDRAQLQRGYQVYKEVCASCHSMDLVKFRNLSDAGGPEFSEAAVKALAAEYEIEDGPDVEGEMFMRPRLPKDAMPAPFANNNAAKASNGGALPPDLSLIAKARGHYSFKDLFMGRDGLTGGSNYIYNLLVGYEDEVPEYITNADAHFELGDSNFNNFFDGYKIAMSQPLYEDSVTYTDGTVATLEQQSLDVTSFLIWAAEPKMEERKSIGIKVLLYLIILAGLMYAVKRRIWENIKH
ncbi:MAG: cytochrome c1 [Rhizobiales bacterium]|nr:cytochrome c1 [Hyphomicrobiales bacterium]NRB14092.1 cytochrome c1 [Hyphomicrobiales bacterium]